MQQHYCPANIVAIVEQMRAADREVHEDNTHRKEPASKTIACHMPACVPHRVHLLRHATRGSRNNPAQTEPTPATNLWKGSYGILTGHSDYPRGRQVQAVMGSDPRRMNYVPLCTHVKLKLHPDLPLASRCQALGYIFLYFSRGLLPWQGLQASCTIIM